MKTSRKIRATFCILLSLGSIGILLANFTGPPLGVTGDPVFGEPSCNQSECHSGNPLNAPGGSLAISGVPAQYEPGKTYTLRVTINRVNQRRWGFELSSRVASTRQQAGTLVVTNRNLTQVRVQAGIQYISHSENLASTFPDQPGPAFWTFDWIAPASPAGTVRFSCAGNAANFDGSPAGDFIYTSAVNSEPFSPTTLTGLFSHVAVGGGYTNVFTIQNTGDTAATGNLILSDQTGNPLTVIVNEATVAPDSRLAGDLVNATGSSFPLEPPIPPGGTRILVAGPLDPSEPLKAGWARLQTQGGVLNGVGTFQLAIGGTLQTIAGVLASQPVEFATFPVDDDDTQERFTGYAIANTSQEDVRVRLVLVNQDGTVAETLSPTVLNPLGPQRQTARFLFQDLPPARLKFRGSAVLIAEAGKKFGVVALVQNKGLITAIPVIPEKSPVIP